MQAEPALIARDRPICSICSGYLYIIPMLMGRRDNESYYHNIFVVNKKF